MSQSTKSILRCYVAYQRGIADTNGLQVLWASAPKGHLYVSPGHRPGKAPRKIIQPRRGGTRLHHQ